MTALESDAVETPTSATDGVPPPGLPPAALEEILAALGHMSDEPGSPPEQLQTALADPDVRAEVPEATELDELADLDHEVVQAHGADAALLDAGGGVDEEVEQDGAEDLLAGDNDDATSGPLDQMMQSLPPLDDGIGGMDLGELGADVLQAGPVAPGDAGIPAPVDAPVEAPPPTSGPQPSPAPRPPQAPVSGPTQEPTPPGQQGSPPAQGATWEDVSDASKDKTAQQRLDIAWMDGLDAAVLRSIEMEFASGAAEDELLKQDPDYKALVDAQEAELEDIRNQVAEANGYKRVKKTKKFGKKDLKKIEKDEAFIERRDELMEAREIEAQRVRDAGKADVNAGKVAQSVTDPKKGKIKRTEGQMRARTDFMAWATRIFGSPDAVKKHFMTMKTVEGSPSMMMAGKAVDRYEAARKEFEKSHPGQTLPTTGTAMDLRRRHQKNQAIGKLGHPLGVSMDFYAYENPNLIGDVDKKEFPGLNELLVRKFGGGRAQMDVNLSQIEAIGKRAAGGGITADDQKVLDDIAKQFSQVQQTSQNFQNALTPAQKDGLKRARNAYFDLPGLKAELAKLRKRKNKSAADDEKATDLLERIDAAEKDLTRGVAGGISPWTQELQRENAIDSSLSTVEKTNLNVWKDNLKRYDKLDQAGVEASGKTLGLERSAFQGSDKAYKRAVKKKLEEKKKAAAAALETHQFKVEKRVELIKKLSNHKKLFGTGKKNPDGTWDTVDKYSDVAIMQLIEDGMVQKTTKPGRDNRVEVFTAEAVAVLAKYGFAPGNRFGDTMHFDLVEGYSDAHPNWQQDFDGKKIGPRGVVDEQ